MQNLTNIYSYDILTNKIYHTMGNRPPQPQLTNKIVDPILPISMDQSKTQQPASIKSENDKINGLNAKIQDAKTKLNTEITNLQNEISQMGDATDTTKGTVEGFGTNDGGARIIDLINAMKDNNLVLYNAVSSQNYTLDNHLQEMKNTYTTDDQKVYYQLKINNWMFTLTFYLLITYYAFFLLFVYLFHRKNPLMSIYLKLFIFFCIAIYPWVISHIEYYLYHVWIFVTAVINGSPV